MAKPVYDYRKDDLRFRLYPGGNITVSSKDLPERGLYQLDRDDFGITNKEFNSICRDGNAGVELYDALERLVSDVERGIHVEFGGTPWVKGKLAEIGYARAALAKARGEK